MTTIDLNAELYRAMGEIANDENLLAKVLKYVKSLSTTKKEKDSKDWANRFAGAWKDERSAEEIISDIRGLTVVTHNVKHFSHIEGLDIEDWIK